MLDPISATYQSTTSFTVAGDRRSDFIPGRAVYCDCGTDGIKYGYIKSASYTMSVTTVTLEENESDLLTSNLTAVLFSRFKFQRIGGNNPLELLWLTRGKQTVAVEYSSSSQLLLRPGVVHINDDTNEYLYHCPGFNKSVSGLSVSTWYYVYAQPPSTGRVLSETDITVSTTAPTLVTAKQGAYNGSNGSQRCIGAFYTTSAGAITPYSLEGGSFQFRSSYLVAINGTQPSTTWAFATCSIPFANASAIMRFYVTYGNTSANLMTRHQSDTGLTGTPRGSVSSSSTVSVVNAEVPTDSQKQFQYCFDGSVSTNTVYGHLIGFVMPAWIFSASGGGASSTPLFTTASRGLQSCMHAYVSGSSFAVQQGTVHIWTPEREDLYYIPEAITKATSSLGVNTWYAIYVTPPAAGNIITESEVSYSSTMPTYNAAKMGWYDSTGYMRCVGFIIANGSNAVAQFNVTNGGEYMMATSYALYGAAAPSNTWTAVYAALPMGNTPAIVTIACGYSNANQWLLWRPAGTSGWSAYACYIDSTMGWVGNTLKVLTNSNRQFDIAFAGPTTNQVIIYSAGFVLPHGIYTGAAGGLTRSLPENAQTVSPSDVGMKSGLDVSQASASSIYVDAGEIHIDDDSTSAIYTLESQVTKLVGTLTAGAWYGVYVEKPSSESILSDSNIIISSSMPTYSQSKRGWYNSNRRCIMFLLATSTSTIASFDVHHGRVELGLMSGDYPSSQPSNVWTTVALRVPVGGMTAIEMMSLGYANAATWGLWSKGNDANWVSYGGYVDGGMLWSGTPVDMATDANKQVRVAFSSATTNSMALYNKGFVLPKGM